MAGKVIRNGQFEIISEPVLARGCACVILNGIFLPAKLPCAIKMLRLDEEQQKYREDFTRRFNNEVGMLRELGLEGSKSFPRFYGLGTANGEPFFGMEKIVGRTLTNVILDDRVPVADRLSFCIEALKAIAVMHRMGKIHRDVKPGNIMIREAGGVVLIDFSISKSYGGTLQTRALGTTMATPEYAPEDQLNDSANAQPWWDVFSWGVTSYHAVTGFLPYELDPNDPDVWTQIGRLQGKLTADGVERDMTISGSPKDFAGFVASILVGRGQKYKTASDALEGFGKDHH